ncbi:MAG TPA: tyrosine-type recombinase/integrase [Patescibacteria group bacterium]|nr:tyrosine-type recombinase/integrase [Patescibacteria group bacterium]
MAKVRARPESGALYLDFFYRGVRCREQTTLLDGAENRKRVQALLNRIEKEMAQGVFDYAATFPDSSRVTLFATTLPGERPIANTQSGTAPSPASNPSSTAIGTPTFLEFSVTWRTEMTPQWRRLHRLSVDAIFDAHLLPAFGDRTLSSITKADVLAFRAELAKLPGRTGKTLSPASINKAVGILRQCLTEAAERFGLPDVFKGVKRLKARRPDVQPFSLDEVEKIRKNIRSDFRNYVMVRFFTGMRTGEINGLKWKYVDFEKELILVRETFSAGEAEENAKTETSLRDIPMLPMVKEALQQQLSTRNPDSDYVFVTRDGNPIDAHNFANRVWYPLLRYLELDKRRPYQTRHTTATLMLASGENPEWIAKLMGHTNTQMLFTVYSRFVPNLTRQDGLAIAGLLSRRPADSAPAAPTSPPEAELLAALKSLAPAALNALLRKAKADH